MTTRAATQPAEAAFPWEADPAAACPCCAWRGLRIFYELRGAPAQSCLVLPTRDQALAFPRADVRLGHCPACGFVTNTAFDPAAVAYDRRYEETQGFSPTFGAFARSLAERTMERFGLAGKTVLEIGCGKGEFLTLLCELGAARGIGIDPAYVPERNTSDAADRVEVLPELLDVSHGRFEPDAVVCRHTLEHIHDVRGFLSTLRRALGDRTGVDLLFEVPDASRVFGEPAFLDIYNEHCAYFTARSLTTAFEAAGFDVADVWTEYDGQYLLLTARPGAPRAVSPSPDPALAEAVETFAMRCMPLVERWRRTIAEGAADGLRQVVWGSGSKCVAFMTTVGALDAIEYVVDINPHRHGLYMPGLPQRIEPPEHAAAAPPDRVIVMNPVYAGEIRAALAELGVDCEILPVA